MAEYRFLLADTLTDTIVSELPVESVTYSEVLNGPGALTANIRLGAPKPTEVPVSGVPTQIGLPGTSEVLGTVDLVVVALPREEHAETVGTVQVSAADVRAGEHSIYVERDGVLMWGGVIWTYIADVASNVGTIGAEGFFSMVRRRLLLSDYDVTARDQVLIAKDLIDTVQAYGHGDMLLDTSTLVADGTLRDRSWADDEYKNVGEAIEELAAVNNGFDFRVRVRWGATGPVREVIAADAAGRQTDYVLELGRNLELLSLATDATTTVYRAITVGEELDDGTFPQQSAFNPVSVYPRADVVEVASDVSETATLLAKSERRAIRGNAPMRIPSVAIYSDQEPELGAFVVGDIVEIVGIYGAVDFGGDYRITGWDTSIDVSNNERVQLSLAPLEVF